MYQRKSRLQNLILLLLDCICIAVSLIAANFIRNGRLFYSDDVRMNFGVLLGAALSVFLLMNLFYDQNRNLFLRGPLHELFCIVRSNLILFAGAAVVLYFLNLLEAYSRLVFLIFLALDCLFMFLVHQLWKMSLPMLYQYFGETRRLLLAADTAYADALIQDVRNMKDYRYDLIGVVLMDQNCRAKTYQELPVVCQAGELVDFCKTASLDEVIVATDPVRMQKEGKNDLVSAFLEPLAQMGITIHYRIPVLDIQSARQRVLSQFGRFYTVTYANRVAPVGPILLKRLSDLIGGFVGCLFLAVLTVFIGPLIKAESRGPIFFAQKRVGRNGRVFKMYKFRSMYEDAEERKQELMSQNEMNGLMFKMENDPRITKVGRFLRKTSLDEFPQFLNILKGDMSLVGTRPPTLDEFAHYSPYHKKRLSFRPGLTGMWQVSGRSDITDFEEIVRLDVEYIDNWSFLLDVKILLKTVLQVFTGRGAK